MYGFKGSDPRYLTLAPELLPTVHGRAWRCDLKLRTSNRLSGNMATFLNRAVLHEEYLAARRERGAGLPVVLIRGDPWDVSNRLGEEIARAVCRGHLADEFMVIAASFKSASSSPASRLANALTSRHVPLAMRSDDADTVETEGKVLLATRHSSKGLERRFVILLGFNARHFKFGFEDEAQDTCSEAFYVGLTRAVDRLIVVCEAVPGEAHPCVDVEAVNDMVARGVVVRDDEQYPFEDGVSATPVATLTAAGVGTGVGGASVALPERNVTSLVAFLDFEVAARALEGLTWTRLSPESAGNFIDIPTTVPCKSAAAGGGGVRGGDGGMHIPIGGGGGGGGDGDGGELRVATDVGGESVASLTGLAIPAMLEVQQSERAAAKHAAELARLEEEFARDAAAAVTAAASAAAAAAASCGDAPRLADVAHRAESSAASTAAKLSAAREAGPSVPCAMWSQLHTAFSCDQRPPLGVGEAISRLPAPARDAPTRWFTELAALWSVACSVSAKDFVYRYEQLSTFDWIEPSRAAEAVERLKQHVLDWDGPSVKTELLLKVDVLSPPLAPDERLAKPFCLSGQLDLVTAACVWELKCVRGSLTDEHKLQLVCYAWMWARARPGAAREFKLLNVLTGESWRLHVDAPEHAAAVDAAVDELVRAFTAQRAAMDNAAFVEGHARGRAAVEEHVTGDDGGSVVGGRRARFADDSEGGAPAPKAPRVAL